MFHVKGEAGPAGTVGPLDMADVSDPVPGPKSGAAVRRALSIPGAQIQRTRQPKTAGATKRRSICLRNACFANFSARGEALMRRADRKSSRNLSERFANQIDRREGAEGATVAFRGRCVLGRYRPIPDGGGADPGATCRDHAPTRRAQAPQKSARVTTRRPVRLNSRPDTSRIRTYVRLNRNFPIRFARKVPFVHFSFPIFPLFSE